MDISTMPTCARNYQQGCTSLNINFLPALLKSFTFLVERSLNLTSMEGPTLNIVNDEIFSSWQWLVPKGRNCLQLYRVIWGTRLLSIISKENWIFNMEIVSRKLRISTLKSNRQKRIYSKPLAFYTKEICCWLLVENAKTSIGQKKCICTCDRPWLKLSSSQIPNRPSLDPITRLDAAPLTM